MPKEQKKEPTEKKAIRKFYWLQIVKITQIGN